MDPLATAARIVLATLLIVCGLGYAALRFLFAIDAGPQWLGGWPPFLAGLGVAVLGVLLIVF